VGFHCRNNLSEQVDLLTACRTVWGSNPPRKDSPVCQLTAHLLRVWSETGLHYAARILAAAQSRHTLTCHVLDQTPAGRPESVSTVGTVRVHGTHRFHWHATKQLLVEIPCKLFGFAFFNLRSYMLKTPRAHVAHTATPYQAIPFHGNHVRNTRLIAFLGRGDDVLRVACTKEEQLELKKSRKRERQGFRNVSMCRTETTTHVRAYSRRQQ
jgi:hypothetical protein